MNLLRIITVIGTLMSIQLGFGQPTGLPLIQIDALQYQGAFTIPGDDFGDSNANYAAATLGYNSTNNSIFLAGFDLHGAVAEFSIPPLVNSTNLMDLNSASILQNFRGVVFETPDANPQNIDRVTGLYVYNNKLIVNAVEYYDAPADNTHTTLVVDDASAVQTSSISGYFSLNGAAHASGWISEIPLEWQAELGASHLCGNSSELPINSRLPMGISAFAFNASDLINPATNNIMTTTLLDFDLVNPLFQDFDTYDDANFNLLELNGVTPPSHTVNDADIVVGENTLWTELSQASYGFIIPNTSSYLTIGSSGGHNSGIGYKPIQDNGNLCGGPCAYEAEDYYNYYWLWDVNDLLAVKNGTMEAYDVRPYAYGEFEVPFQYDVFLGLPENHAIHGGTYDAASNLLYLSVYDGASTGQFDVRPVVVAYSIDVEALGVKDVERKAAIELLPNPAKNMLGFKIENGECIDLNIYNSIGLNVKHSTTNQIDISSFSPGIYFVNFNIKGGGTITKKLIVN